MMRVYEEFTDYRGAPTAESARDNDRLVTDFQQARAAFWSRALERKAALRWVESHLETRDAIGPLTVEEVLRLDTSGRLRERLIGELRRAPKSSQLHLAARELAPLIAEMHRRRDRFAEANIRLAVSLALKLRNKYASHLSGSDLAQECMIGLLRALETFDPRRGFRFATYCTWWLRHCATRAIQDFGRTIRVPVHRFDQATRMAAVSSKLQTRLGRHPSREELAMALGITMPELEHLLEVQYAKEIPLDAPICGDDDASVWADFLEAPVHEPVEDITLDRQSARLLEVIAELHPPVADIICRRYGLAGRQPETLKEIGDTLGVTRERIRQIEVKAIEYLRSRLTGGKPVRPPLSTSLSNPIRKIDRAFARRERRAARAASATGATAAG